MMVIQTTPAMYVLSSLLSFLLSLVLSRWNDRCAQIFGYKGGKALPGNYLFSIRTPHRFGTYLTVSDR